MSCVLITRKASKDGKQKVIGNAHSESGIRLGWRLGVQRHRMQLSASTHSPCVVHPLSATRWADRATSKHNSTTATATTPE